MTIDQLLQLKVDDSILVWDPKGSIWCRDCHNRFGVVTSIKPIDKLDEIIIKPKKEIMLFKLRVKAESYSIIESIYLKDLHTLIVIDAENKELLQV